MNYILSHLTRVIYAMLFILLRINYTMLSIPLRVIYAMLPILFILFYQLSTHQELSALPLMAGMLRNLAT